MLAEIQILKTNTSWQSDWNLLDEDCAVIIVRALSLNKEFFHFLLAQGMYWMPLPEGSVSSWSKEPRGGGGVTISQFCDNIFHKKGSFHFIWDDRSVINEALYRALNLQFSNCWVSDGWYSDHVCISMYMDILEVVVPVHKIAALTKNW